MRINQVISRILYETVTDSANLPTLPERDIPNDEYMDRELKQAIRPAQVVFSTSMQDASVPSSQEQLPPDERSQEIPTIEVWLGGIGALYPPGKIRKQLTQSLPQWQELVAPLSPVGRAKFYGEFKESLVGESRGEAFTARDHEVGLLVQDAKQFVKTLLKDETNRKKETLFE